MVEMRWLERYVDDVMRSDIIGKPATPIKRLERALQYRIAVDFIATQEQVDMDRIELINCDRNVTNWSEWQDVPVVREG